MPRITHLQLDLLLAGRRHNATAQTKIVSLLDMCEHFGIAR